MLTCLHCLFITMCIPLCVCVCIYVCIYTHTYIYPSSLNHLISALFFFFFVSDLYHYITLCFSLAKLGKNCLFPELVMMILWCLSIYGSS